jgi:cell division protein FtsI (penicillin-binding protein 3)
MRKMMEGVVLYGTGKPAQLNGYSSGGKTGTAQKIDPVTHTYSKTMHIASFAGIAPVNNPVISVAVVIDNPTKGNSYYGTAVSAPVFAEVAQQVLEYLGVPHDIELQAPRVKSKPEATIAEDDATDQGAGIDNLFAAINDLPSDDPLRAAQAQAASTGQSATQPAKQAASLPTGLTAYAQADSGQPVSAVHRSTPQQATPLEGRAQPEQATKSVMVSDARKLKVPSLVGLPVRKVIEQAAAVGLAVQISGNGTVREQAPTAGTMVAIGTQIVVRCAR